MTSLCLSDRFQMLSSTDSPLPRSSCLLACCLCHFLQRQNEEGLRRLQVSPCQLSISAHKKGKGFGLSIAIRRRAGSKASKAINQVLKFSKAVSVPSSTVERILSTDSRVVLAFQP